MDRQATEQGLTYVHLGGDIGVIGNGAGLVMNTLDVVTGAAASRPISWTSGAAPRLTRWSRR